MTNTNMNTKNMKILNECPILACTNYDIFQLTILLELSMTKPFVSYFLLLIDNVSRVSLVECQSKTSKYFQIPKE
jgi:hypothetical protein